MTSVFHTVYVFNTTLRSKIQPNIHVGHHDIMTYVIWNLLLATKAWSQLSYYLAGSAVSSFDVKVMLSTVILLDMTLCFFSSECFLLLPWSQVAGESSTGYWQKAVHTKIIIIIIMSWNKTHEVPAVFVICVVKFILEPVIQDVEPLSVSLFFGSPPCSLCLSSTGGTVGSFGNSLLQVNVPS